MLDHTPMAGFKQALSDPKVRQAAMDSNLMKRLAQPEEIATAIRWLLSDEASFVTGSVYTVDGGGTTV